MSEWDLDNAELTERTINWLRSVGKATPSQTESPFPKTLQSRIRNLQALTAESSRILDSSSLRFILSLAYLLGTFQSTNHPRSPKSNTTYPTFGCVQVKTMMHLRYWFLIWTVRGGYYSGTQMTRLPSNETMCKTRDVNEDQPSTVKIVLPQVPFEDKNPAAKAAIEMRKRKYHLAGKRIVDQSC